jgi:hypothetical protein
METKPLYLIEKEYLALNEQILNLEGEITPELNEALKINETELQSKGNGYAYVIKKNEAECDIIDAEIKRLQSLKKVRQNATERLKEAIKRAMELYQIAEIKTPLIKINFRKSESVEITDSEKIPSEFVVWEKTINKIAIKNKIREGLKVEGAELKENKNLQIR